jgi:hypothetical protein
MYVETVVQVNDRDTYKATVRLRSAMLSNRPPVDAYVRFFPPGWVTMRSLPWVRPSPSSRRPRSWTSPTWSGSRVATTSSRRYGRRGFSGSSRSGLSSSSTLTSLNVSTRTFRTNRAGRYMSQTQASESFSSK